MSATDGQPPTRFSALTIDECGALEKLRRIEADLVAPRRHQHRRPWRPTRAQLGLLRWLDADSLGVLRDCAVKPTDWTSIHALRRRDLVCRSHDVAFSWQLTGVGKKTVESLKQQGLLGR